MDKRVITKRTTKKAKIVKAAKERGANEFGQRSKAPTPFKGVSTSRPSNIVHPEIKWRTVVEKPNWKEWKCTPLVRVWQACALSLDVEPYSINVYPLSWQTGPYADQLFEDESFQSENEKKEFKSRQRILLNNLNSKENSLWFSPNPNRPNLGEVSLPEFAAWCPSVEWPIPKELEALAKKPDAAPVTKEENKQTSSTPIKSVEKQEIKGVEKQKIINSFKEIHYKDWSKQLSTPRSWLEPCRMEKGSKGKETKSALWDPVCIALELLDKEAKIKAFDQINERIVNLKDFDRIFDNLPDWADKWYEKSEFLREQYT